MLLEVKNLNVNIDDIQILSNISFSLEKGKILSLLGHNGSGKTTLLKGIMGLIPAKGKIIFKQEEIQNLSITERAKKGIGYIMQEVPEYTGILVGDYVKNVLTKFNKFDEKKISELFDLFGMDWNIYKERNFDSHLSGGEKKKIEIITSFLLDRDLYLLDEIEVSLDATSRQILVELISELKKNGKSFIIVSHHEELIKLGDKALLLCNGKMQEYGNLESILNLYLGKCEDCNLKNNCGE